MKTAHLVRLFLGVFFVCLALTAHAQTFVFTTFMTGPNESPPNASNATGSATVTLDITLHTLRIEFNWTGLSGNASIAHIHGATAQPFTGTASPATNASGFPGLPATTSGSYDMTFNTGDNATWNDAYRNGPGGGTALGAESAFLQDTQDGQMYFNVHSTAFPGGEIRGFLVPEPGTVALITIGGVGLLLAARRARRS